MAKSAKLRVRLVKSPIGAIPKHRRTVRCLGLRRLNQVVEHKDTPAIRGMIRTVNHLVDIEE
jgi:large subunit ribosomal protein L30